MGGKNKKGDRVKNNARPSSSSHCAELLGSEVPIFFDFTAGKGSFFSLSVEQGFNISTDFQIVFKKMTKKDSTTKLKALQELTDLCKNSEADTVKMILPFWPNYYCLLALDVEHRVREAVHVAHAAIVEKVKKSIAPYLKQIAGPWFTSQYDSYPPAASAATFALQQAFPSTKLVKAIIFCQEEILNYIYETLIQHSSQFINNPKFTKPEDVEAKYQRTVIACFQGYKFYLQKLSCEEIKEAEEINRKIISAPKFWQYSKHKTPLIRNSFFNVLVSLCQNANFLLKNETKNVSNAIFNDLDDSDPVVINYVWEAALNALIFLEGCWTNVDLEKHLFDKLNTMIRRGGRNAITIFPNILPILIKVPPDLFKDKSELYVKLLSSIRTMIEGSSLTNPSYSDARTVAGTFIECLKFIIKQHNSDKALCTTLVSDFLVSVLEKMFTTPDSTNSPMALTFIAETSSLIRLWHSGKSSDDVKLDEILKFFWESLLNSCRGMIEAEPSVTKLTTILSMHLEFLKVFQNPTKYLQKPKRQLKFAVEASSNEEATENEKEKTKEVKCEPEFDGALLIFARRLSGAYLRNCIVHQHRVYIKVLSEILNLFDSKSIFEEFLRIQNEATIYSLFCNLYCKWLENPNLRGRELVQLCFSLFQHLEKNEKELFLQKFFNDWFNSELLYDICNFPLNYTDDDCIKSWISTPSFSGNLVQLTRDFVDSDSDNQVFRDVLTSFFKASDKNGECVIGDDTASRIIDLLSNSLRTKSDRNHIRQLAQNAMVHINPKKELCRGSYEELAVALFKLSIYYSEDEGLINSCDVGLRRIMSNAGDDFTKKIAWATSEIILSDKSDLCLKQVISRVNYFVELSIGCNLKGGRCSNSDIAKAVGVITLFVAEPRSIAKSRKRLEKFCFLGHQSVGECDMSFVKLKKKMKGTSAGDENVLDGLLSEIARDFELADKSGLISGGAPDSRFGNVAKYYRLFDKYRKFPECKEPPSKSDLDSTSKMIRIFSKWNIYVGSVLNLVASAHPKCYRTSVLLEDWSPYVTEERKSSEAEWTNLNLPIRITKEEMEGLKGELESISDGCSGSEYEEKINFISICAETLNFIYSIALVGSFTHYYTSTKYFRIVEELATDLKKIGKDFLMNANLLENLFLYNSCKHLASEMVHWRIIKPVLQELFYRKFVDDSAELEPGFVKDFIQKESSEPVSDNALLTLYCIIRSKSVFSIEKNEWNKIFIYLHKFFESFKLGENFSEGDLVTLSILSRITLRLIKMFRESPATDTDERLCPEACLAWNEVVRGELWNKFFMVWHKFAEKWHDKELSPETLIAVQNVGEVVLTGDPLEKDSEKENLKLMMECSRFITSSYAAFQITSFHLLMKFVPGLVKIDTETYLKNLSKITDNMKGGSLKTSSIRGWTCENLEKTLSLNKIPVETLLSDFVIGDHCRMEPFTDAFNCTYSYLLMWCFLLEMCGEADSCLRFQYGFWLRDKGFTKTLLESIFKLMPRNVVHGPEAKEQYQKYFENHVPPGLKEPITSERIEQVSCFVYRMLLQRLPNITREWFNQSENKVSIIVDKLTSLYVSPIIIGNELRSVQPDRDGGFDNMEVKTHPNAREVIATYVIDEVKMDFVMTLPQNYPLGTIKVDSSKVVVSNSSRRNWLFHISKYLIHQNGTIWEALVMWKNNLDKKFEGVEECFICASILQGSTFETPRVCCQICKNKFHSNCLYKWFSTSNNSSCPICRTLF